MSFQIGKTLADHPQYTINQTDTGLLFTWKHVKGMSIADMASGVTKFANLCKSERPGAIIFDARNIDPESPALAWVSSQKKFEGEEEYTPWWLREIVPLYNEAGVGSLAVATGNPQAPGALPQVPPGVEFEIGYFNGLDDATGWKVG